MISIIIFPSVCNILVLTRLSCVIESPFSLFPTPAFVFKLPHFHCSLATSVAMFGRFHVPRPAISISEFFD